jgi:hypothetical protein
VDPLEESTAADMPATVRYYFVDGDYLAADKAAAQGVKEELDVSASGLYRETIPTAALAEESDPLADNSQADGVKFEHLAPEVVKIEFQYFDGEQLVDEWDSSESAGLPLGVEIRLTLHEPAFESDEDEERQAQATAGRFSENELVEYRRFVRILPISPQQPAEALLPTAAGDEQGRDGGSDGEAGGRGDGGAEGADGQGGGDQQGRGGRDGE